MKKVFICISGIPTGSEKFVVLLERMLHRPLLPRKRGPKFNVKTKNNLNCVPEILLNF